MCQNQEKAAPQENPDCASLLSRSILYLRPSDLLYNRCSLMKHTNKQYIVQSFCSWWEQMVHKLNGVPELDQTYELEW